MNPRWYLPKKIILLIDITLTFLSLIVLVVNSITKKNKILKNVEQRLAREQRIKKAQKMENTL